MTKSQFRVLKEAREIIARLSDTDRINESMNKTYRGTLGSCDDELGMLILTVENNPEVFEHPYWNDDLHNYVKSGKLDKTKRHDADIAITGNGEYSTYINSYSNETAVEPDGQYIEATYMCEEDAKEDVEELKKAGFRIVT